MDTFQNRLNEALQKRGMSAAELARNSGVNEGSISCYRKGKFKASQDGLENLARVLNVPIPWLMGADVPSPFEPALNKNKDKQILSIINSLSYEAQDELLRRLQSKSFDVNRLFEGTDFSDLEREYVQMYRELPESDKSFIKKQIKTLYKTALDEGNIEAKKVEQHLA